MTIVFDRMFQPKMVFGNPGTEKVSGHETKCVELTEGQYWLWISIT